MNANLLASVPDHAPLGLVLAGTRWTGAIVRGRRIRSGQYLARFGSNTTRGPYVSRQLGQGFGPDCNVIEWTPGLA